MTAQALCLLHTFSQQEFDRFARLSGDINPIHVDHGFATQSRFGRTVAHGLLLCSRLRGMMEQLRPGLRLQQQSVMFPAPTYAGDAMEFSVLVTGQQGPEILLELQVKRVEDGIITCQGQARMAP